MLSTLARSWYFESSYLLVGSLVWTFVVSLLVYAWVSLIPKTYLPFLFLLIFASAIVLKWVLYSLIISQFIRFDEYFRLGLEQRDITSSLPNKPAYTLHQWYDLLDQLLDRLYQNTHTISEVEDRYQSILDTQSEFVFKIDENRFMIYSNRSFNDFISMGSDQNDNFLVLDFLVDNVVSDIIKQQEKLLESLKEAPEGIEFTVNLFLAGEEHIVRWHAICVREHVNDSNSACNYVFVGRDITNTLKLEERARRQESLATVGQSASFICHEISQPLSVIELATRNLMDLRQSNLLSANDFEQKTATVLANVSRISKISRELTHFGRYSSQGDSVFDLHELVSDTLDEGRDLSRHARIKTPQPQSQQSLLVNGNSTLFRQVICNLLKNSSYALAKNKPENPEITLDVWHDTLGVNLRVKDNAGGVPTRDLEKLLMPFYSTKPPGEGSGLGLAFCFDVVQKMAGSIECKNDEQKGFSVHITLPQHQAANSAA